MKKLVFKIMLVIDLLAFVVLSFCTQFITKYDSETGIITDGLGRVLTEAPRIFRAQGLLSEWAGVKWFAIDSVCAFVMLAVAYFLFLAIRDDKKD